jgi:WD40 repeat protein
MRHHYSPNWPAIAIFLAFGAVNAAGSTFILAGNGDGGLRQYDTTGNLLKSVSFGANAEVQGMDLGANNDLYVLIGSNSGNRILMYDPYSLTLLGTLVDTTQSASLDNPIGIGFGPDGNLYVADDENDRIAEFNGTTGNYLGTFASGGGLVRPQHFVFSGGNLYVSAGSTPDIIEYNGTTGAYEQTFVSDSHGLTWASGLAFGPDGDVYLAGNTSNTIDRFTASGNFISTISGSGLASPTDITFGPDGLLYVAGVGSSGGSVKAFDPVTGALMNSFSDGTSTTTSLLLVSTPEPGTSALVALAGFLLLIRRLRDNRCGRRVASALKP